MPSLFSLANPPSLFQVWFVVYLYLLPFLLYAAWASLALMDLCERDQDSARLGWGAFVILVPLVGGAWYLLGAARTLKRSARIAIVCRLDSSFGCCRWPSDSGWPEARSDPRH